jgi:hypothetical protein
MDPLWFPPLQPTQVHSQPVVHKQEMIYPQPVSTSGYSEWNQSSTMIGLGSNFPAYPQTPYSDSAFQDSEASHSYFKVDTELDSDSGQSMRGANAFNDGPAETRRTRGPFNNLHDRAQTAQTRKDRSCIRCRAQRIRVCATSAVSYHANK